jgi:hypothetical protein
MRRVPSVNPEMLQKVTEAVAKLPPGTGTDLASLGIPVEVSIRCTELQQYGLPLVLDLPPAFQKLAFKIAATIPLTTKADELDGLPAEARAVFYGSSWTAAN